MGSYLRQLTRIHKVIFQQVKGATADRDAEIPYHLLTIRPGDQVYLKVIKRRWDQPRREGPYTVILTTTTAVKVAGKGAWFNLSSCIKAPQPEPGASQENRVTEEGAGQAAPRVTSQPHEGDGVTSPQGIRISQRLAARHSCSDSNNRDTPPDHQELLCSGGGLYQLRVNWCRQKPS